MHQRTTVLTFVAAALLAVAPTVASCGNQSHPSAPTTAPTTTTTNVAAAPAPAVPLPPPEMLTDVLYKLSDTSVPGGQKVALIEGATPENAEQIDKFGKALEDNHYTPLGFTAENIAWSNTTPGNVTADVAVHSENPQLRGGFTFPMEFAPAPQGGWQLSRQTADILLTMGQNATAPTG